jgi:hypothetical protein
VLLESRKDFANRARGQGTLPGPGRWPRVSPIRGNAGPGSATTRPAIPQ